MLALLMERFTASMQVPLIPQRVEQQLLLLLLRLLDPAVGIAGADSCIFFGAFALCLYAAGTWISQSISQGGMDAPKLSSMHNMVGLLYVLSVLLGPVLLLRLGWEQWRKRRAANAAPWEKADDT